MLWLQQDALWNTDLIYSNPIVILAESQVPRVPFVCDIPHITGDSPKTIAVDTEVWWTGKLHLSSYIGDLIRTYTS